ncbi:MAG: GrpB family protein [Staphylococcus epidermidis]|nr:GrpB family protein [Staphylococcus epidermidis]
MYANVQPFIKNESVKQFTYEYNKVKDVLFTILDSPIKYTQHIGGTCHFNYQTEPILDILVGVNNLHDITSLDEKRLNYAGFYRLHHSYKKKVVMARFNNLNDKAIAEWFASKKNEIVQHAKKIREYESQKQNLFEKLYKESNLLS